MIQLSASCVLFALVLVLMDNSGFLFFLSLCPSCSSVRCSDLGAWQTFVSPTRQEADGGAVCDQFSQII